MREKKVPFGEAIIFLHDFLTLHACSQADRPAGRQAVAQPMWWCGMCSIPYTRMHSSSNQHSI